MFKRPTTRDLFAQVTSGVNAQLAPPARLKHWLALTRQAANDADHRAETQALSVIM